MTVFVEGNLQLTVNGAVSARKFDGPSHGLSHCMKAVDFIIELPDGYQFVEFKNPQDPGATQQAISKYLNDFTAGKLDNQFQYKYRDSFLYEWALGRANKPIDYLMLIAINSLTTKHLLNRMQAMQRKMPLMAPGKQPWSRPFVRSCSVFNIASWNNQFPNYPIVRLPSQPPPPET